MNAIPKHQAVSRQLASEITAGKFNQSGKLPSEAQLVQRFGVSRPTVGRALRDLQEQSLIERRAGSGTYLRTGSAPGKGARPTTLQLGLIVPNLRSTEIFESICGTLASLARQHDCGLWWSGSARPAGGDADMSVEEAEALCSQFIERGVAGVFFAPFEHRADREDANRRIIDRLRTAGIPVVLLDRDIGPFPHRSALDLVGIDNFAGGFLLAEHLIKLGARRLAYVTRPLSASTVEGRIAGARTAILAHGLEIPRTFVFAGDPADAKFVRTFTQLRTFDALICASDQVSAVLLQTLTRLRVSVPKDVQLVGFDDVRFASLLTVPLTTMEQPCPDLALTAFRAMLERIGDPVLPARMLLLTPRLVVRESCGAYRGK
jgi:LacI family transcriptional regulator